MIPDSSIKRLYKTYAKRPANIDELKLPILVVRMSYIKPGQELVTFAEIDSKKIRFNAIPADNPFHEIPVGNVCGIEYIGDTIAIVTANSIVFVNSNTGEIKVHVKPPKFTVLERLKFFLCHSCKLILTAAWA